MAHSSKTDVILHSLKSNVRTKNSAADYEAYLEMYPSGYFAAEARRQVPVLHTAPAVKPAAIDSMAIEQRVRLSHLERVLIQRGLKVLGIDARQPDGAIGPRTRRAIRTCQGATGAGKRAIGAKDNTKRASLRPSARKPSDASGEKPSRPSTAPTDPPLNREAIKNAIVEFMINVGSDNCWGNRYFCYFDDLKIKSIETTNEAQIRVITRYGLLSSETLQANSDRRNFESDFILLNEGTKFRVTSIHTDSRFKRTDDEYVPDTASE